MKREDLHFHGQIDPPDLDMVGYLERCRGEAQHGPDAGPHQQVAYALSSVVRGRDHADRGGEFAGGRFEPVDVPDGQVAHPGAHPRRVGVEQSGHREAAAVEPCVAGQCATEIADADEDHAVSPVEAERVLDAGLQAQHVVPDATHPVGAEEGQILAEFRGTDPGCGGEFLARDDERALVGEHSEDPQVRRETRHSSLGDVPHGDTGRRTPVDFGDAAAGGIALRGVQLCHVRGSSSGRRVHVGPHGDPGDSFTPR
ncbi:hypothetical protein RHRU231_350085 [Rhodococcus ruber]|uniref:Uncharacterized protein n=1 Tax=Rhodococcus ruber TaxID=1830 RepID=A0A098BGK7_9NOCA|nr:hypothetical protein RHRU231_350085 [Rhodococcus ruber]